MADTFSKSETPRRLSELLAEPGRWSLRERLALVHRLALQVQSLHQSGRTHREICLEQVIVDQQGGPQLLPPPGPRCFGGEDADPEFCPPQLAAGDGLELPEGIEAAAAVLKKSGHALDPRRIDIYQLGTLLCRLLTGAPVLTYMYDPLVKAKVPTIARSVLQRALGENAEGPFEDCQRLIQALEEAVRQADSAEGPSSVHETPARGSAVGAGSDTPPGGSQAASGPQPAGDLPFEGLGHYRILGRIGRGGIGDVYRGYDDSLDRQVAIKVLPAELARDEDFVRRFHAEATATAKLAHPNVVPVYFIGEDAGHHFFAMQFIEGESLSERLARQRRLEVDETLEIVGQCLAGLKAAHARGLIHRDIKPGNILLERDTGRAMLVDFGLVRMIGQSARMTATGLIMGTVDYIAPEQARGQPVDGRADIYSLGVLLYQLLSGRLPFEAETPTAMIFQHAYEEPFPLREAAPDVPQPVADIVARMMAKEPEERYADCGEVLADLEAFRQRRPLAAVPESVEPATGVPAAREPPAEPELPANLAKLADDRRWVRVRDWAATMLRRHAPEFVKELQSTTQQVDGAVAHYERRRGRVATLHEEASSLAAELAGQLQANVEALAAAVRTVESAPSDRQQAALAKKQQCEEHIEALRRQLDDQQRQVEELEHQLGKADATLARLRSQRDVLKARLHAAEARQKLEGGQPQRRRRVWVSLGAAAAAGLGVVVLLLGMLSINRNVGPYGVIAVPEGRDVPKGSGRVVSLLEKVNPSQYAVAGQWEYAAGILSCTGGNAARISFPYSPPEEYDYVVEFTPTDPPGCIALLVSRGDVPFTWSLNTRGQMARLEDVNGHSVSGNPTFRKYVLEGGKNDVAEVRVRDSGVTCLINDRVVPEEFRTDYGNLSRNPNWAMPNQRLLGVGLWSESAAAFHRVEVREITGQGTWEKPASPSLSGHATPILSHPAPEAATSGPPPPTPPAPGPIEPPPGFAGKPFDPAAAELRGALYVGGNNVNALAFSPDGKTLFSVSRDDHRVRIWDIATARLRGTLGDLPEMVSGGTYHMQSVAMSADGSLLAWGGTRPFAVNVWHPATGGEGQTLGRHYDDILGVAVNPDGSIVASGSIDKTVRLWDVAKGELLRTIEAHSDRVSAVAFSPDGLTVASAGGDKTLKLWNVPTGELRQTLQASGGPTCVAFSPDGSLIACGNGDHTLMLWAVATGEPLRTLKGHTAGVVSIAFSPDGATLASLGSDYALRFWDVATGELRRTLEGFDRTASGLAFSPDGSLLAIGDFQTIRLWGSGPPIAEEAGADALGPSGAAGQPAVPPKPSEPPSAPDDSPLLTNSIGMKLVRVPAGESLMGSSESPEAVAKAFGFPPEYAKYYTEEGRQHRVKISKAFYLGAYEVTVGQFRRFVEATAYRTDAEKDGKGGYGWNEAESKIERLNPKYSWRNTGFTQGDDHPVVNVSWDDAVAFCQWLSQKEGKQYRLPTEAEWEYACRAGTTTRYYSGNDPESLVRVGNVADGTAKVKFSDWTAIAGKDGYVFTAPVGRFQANDFGLYDMHGNVSEWCADPYDAEYYRKSPSVDPQGPSSAENRVVRNGSWCDGPSISRSANRNWGTQAYRDMSWGFRVARNP